MKECIKEKSKLCSQYGAVLELLDKCCHHCHRRACHLQWQIHEGLPGHAISLARLTFLTTINDGLLCKSFCCLQSPSVLAYKNNAESLENTEKFWQRFCS